ncbi:MAG: hypothetical protein OXL97_15660 [Chloroflexota bacterium]|nr:hypothetical protein [Chloroflexota bacterium]MDE2885956.1 hypothetical protein [Chloroflexota bacterium]
MEEFIVERIKDRILTEETIIELVSLVAEEIDAVAGEANGRLQAINAELGDAGMRLENLYQVLETKQLPMDVLSPRILALKGGQDQLVAAREEAESQLEQRRMELPTSEEIREYVADFREFLQEGTFPERKALLRNFVEGYRDRGRGSDADVHYPHATGRGGPRVGIGSRFCPEWPPRRIEPRQWADNCSSLLGNPRSTTHE